MEIDYAQFNSGDTFKFSGNRNVLLFDMGNLDKNVKFGKNIKVNDEIFDVLGIRGKYSVASDKWFLSVSVNKDVSHIKKINNAVFFN